MASSESFQFAVSVALSRQCNRRSERGWTDATADGTVWSLCVVLMILVCRSITIFLRLRALKEMEVRSVDNINIMLIIFLLYLLKKSKETVKTNQSSMPQTSVNQPLHYQPRIFSNYYLCYCYIIIVILTSSATALSAYTIAPSSPIPHQPSPLQHPDPHRLQWHRSHYPHQMTITTRTTKVFPITTTTATKTYATTALIKHTTTTTITRFHIPQKLTKG